MAHNRDKLNFLGALPFSQRLSLYRDSQICQNTQQALAISRPDAKSPRSAIQSSQANLLVIVMVSDF